ncbi:hypothetical protein VF14_22240 [Nostoc linckia z18]|jgi:hypothetical protein|uniref:Uncharacterized protein n=2 Tax=Nostoc linckia TaxID=92942 RepID=A0A9Q5Z9J0_NOSLI|nr:hypothetical protein [Nostoc linckia]PHJ56710.1 hypothetical protein VF02_32335 [Nostoc linckia z1]PHJ62395.1 hypothetical protein VF03_31430 [Nostoc linckia z2]PHJ68202.1 hypothetical protein VF05_16045 [Nostoc linckia z3]PHJ96873.1 hypothetical protein VF04_14465 [Nostoc linckia z7]PHK01138.1 hypothetical protein VF08_22570 [Nostoc linckia z8]PHK10222.1 hypothetical protein VF09_12395 [Nostoc linckia z9]PHK18057.1 hypothetical protein VF11_20145 [Nostoc linckia z14]PHK32076.1 hypotheti
MYLKPFPFPLSPLTEPYWGMGHGAGEMSFSPVAPRASSAQCPIPVQFDRLYIVIKFKISIAYYAIN